MPSNTDIDLQIIAPCFYPHIEAAHLKYFVESSMRYGLMPVMYGLGSPFKNWIDTHVTECLNVLRSLDATHVLFTDASDAIFLQSLDTITKMYKWLGCPEFMMSAEPDGLLNAGGWVGAREAAIDMLKIVARIKDSEDPQTRFRQLADVIEIPLDTTHSLFHVGEENLTVMDGEEFGPIVMNNETSTAPCVLHFAGGYTDQVVGKQDRIEPLWKELGYAL